MQFSRELRSDVLAGDITLSVRLWKRPRVKEGGRYPVGFGDIQVDSVELVPFAAITEEDVQRQGGRAPEGRLRRNAIASVMHACRVLGVFPSKGKGFELSRVSRCSGVGAVYIAARRGSL